MEVQATRDPGILDFEKAYLNLRQKENRILPDEEVVKLPHAASSNPHYQEWKSRQASCQRLKKYLAKKKPPLQVLEVGCGNGWLSKQLSQIPGADVTGTDINSYELEQAERVFGRSPNLHFFYGDVESAGIRERQFDVIVFAASIQYFPSINSILNQAMKLLKPGGEIHVLDTHLYEQEDIPQAKKRSEAYFSQLGYPEMAAFYFHQALRELEKFTHTVLYRPSRFAGIFQLNANPFYWICITNPEHITVLPIVILMPHSACNCRCIMCDIWKDNKNLKQLTENDISGLVGSLRKLETRKVLMSGGEALLNPNFFRLCELLKQEGITISLLSTGLTLEKQADTICRFVDDVIISLDGDEPIHDKIRNIPGAFRKLSEGVQALKMRDPQFRITARTVIQRQNFRAWTRIIDAALDMGLDQISFLPADTSSHAFNREVLWSDQRQQEIVPAQEELPELKKMMGEVISRYAAHPGFIAESPEKLRKIYGHYAAFYGLNEYPYKKCNAPWVSVVVEADGNVRPCFFHESIGNTREHSLSSIINNEKALAFRRDLDIRTNPVCVKCVCSINLPPGARL